MGAAEDAERAVLARWADELRNHDHGRHCTRCAAVMIENRRLRDALQAMESQVAEAILARTEGGE